MQTSTCFLKSNYPYVWLCRCCVPTHTSCTCSLTTARIAVIGGSDIVVVPLFRCSADVRIVTNNLNHQHARHAQAVDMHSNIKLVIYRKSCPLLGWCWWQTTNRWIRQLTSNTAVGVVALCIQLCNMKQKFPNSQIVLGWSTRIMLPGK